MNPDKVQDYNTQCLHVQAHYNKVKSRLTGKTKSSDYCVFQGCGEMFVTPCYPCSETDDIDHSVNSPALLRSHLSQVHAIEFLKAKDPCLALTVFCYVCHAWQVLLAWGGVETY